MIPVLIPPAPAPLGSAAGPNADRGTPAAPGDGFDGGTFVDLLSLLIATAAAPTVSAPSPVVVAVPDSTEGPVDTAHAPPAAHAEKEEASSLRSEDQDTLVALQLLMAATTTSPPNGAMPIPPVGSTSGDSPVASSVVGTKTDPMGAVVAPARHNRPVSPLTPSIPASDDAPPEAGAALGVEAPVQEIPATSPDTHAITLTAAGSPIPAEALEPTAAVPEAVEVAPRGKPFERTPGIFVPVAPDDPGVTRDALEVASFTEPHDRLRPQTDNATAGVAVRRKAAPPDGPAETVPLEDLVANRHGEPTRSVSGPLPRLDDRAAGARALPAEREDGSSSASPAATPSGISLPGIEQGRTARDFARDQEETRRASTPARPEAPRGTERVEGVVTTGDSASARGAAGVASIRDELPQMNVERVVSAARASLARGGMEVRLHLHPESLGEVRVQVRWESGTLSARLEAATPAARDALESGTPALRATLQEHGIPVERLSVNVRMDGEARSQHRPRASESPVPDESTRDGSNAMEPTPTLDSVTIGRVDIRI